MQDLCSRYTSACTMSEPCISLDDVSHLYGQSAVLRRVSVELAGGAYYLLLGANGAGKSTLLRVLAGLLRPSFGSVKVWGDAPGNQRERIGYMSHAPMLFDEYTAAENLRFFASLYPRRSQLTPAEALESVGLDPGLRRYLGAYSQGMRQRVSLARALLTRPDLLLLDEPFSNMDDASAQAMLRRLRAERDAGRTVVLTTHQRALAAPVADAVLILEHGALLREAVA